MSDTTTVRALLEPRHLRLADEHRTFAVSEITATTPRHDGDGVRKQALRTLRGRRHSEGVTRP